MVDNAEICTYIDSSDEWIRTRSGIVERRWASPRRDDPDDVGVRRPWRAGTVRSRARADRHRHRVHRHPPCTRRPRWPPPSPPSWAQGAAAFDISAACAGFCYATAMADSFIRSGASKYVLIIGVERLSGPVRPARPLDGVHLADGAGAAVIGPSETAGNRPVVWGSDGEQASLIGRPNRGTRPYVTARVSRRTGRSCGWRATPVFKWASTTMAKTAAGTDAAGVRPEDLKVFAPHQANMPHGSPTPCSGPQAAGGSRGRPRHRPCQGNTSAASIPLAIEALLESARPSPATPA